MAYIGKSFVQIKRDLGEKIHLQEMVLQLLLILTNIMLAGGENLYKYL